MDGLALPGQTMGVVELLARAKAEEQIYVDGVGHARMPLDGHLCPILAVPAAPHTGNHVTQTSRP
ncbi:hypothetical protein [Streptomyces sp. NRRL F-2664]|uniref:hypothetical protein n=1 Tax=Streptomyces sp. NRRL F-2664 TaxID=1463842 RepID=UPI001F2E1979|nr:hypothetical protein [Streptomyces sp. NRRL F-2664]